MLRLAAALRGLAVAAAALLTVTVLPSGASAGTAPSPPSSASPASSPVSFPSARPKAFVALREVDPTILQEMRYFTPHNFTGVPVDGYRRPTCLLTRDAARALHRAQRSFLRRGFSLKVYDCYRPQRAVDQFVRWAKDLGDQRMKAEFYPRVDKTRLFDDGYIAAKSGHSRGSTLDVTLVRLPAVPTRPYVPGEPLTPCYGPKADRFPDNSLDMGTGFDCFDTLAHTLDPRIHGKQRANRLLLKKGLERAGFVNLPEEWWHFTFQPETFPDTYFDFPVE
ncbi:M15 family metallopeptidase [Streptomyces gilvosporeus]|uniref:D-alanyl-D-alanine dipeptidase n=1 Tax=Streptomyces gilvosporeus TaxID=553510 RepID=A0A1V0TME8_9ACTN|nr:M15 family metallopeptidase [Streptomyces gilvosporeus]ARF54097.1 D-alanyl-D-alanine dipeptidase [Streptomyces gilvosporeus]